VRGEGRGDLLGFGCAAAFNRDPTRSNDSVDLRRGENPAVEQDRQALTEGLAGRIAERSGVRLIEFKDDRICGPLILRKNDGSRSERTE
jgi:hypothetical protein